MQWKEKRRVFPGKLKFPYISSPKEKDCSDRQSFDVDIDTTLKCLVISGEEGTFILDSPEKVLELIKKRKYTIFLTRKNIEDWLWVSFPLVIQVAMKTYRGKFYPYRDYNLRTFNGKHITFSKGKDWRYITFFSPNSTAYLDPDEPIKEFLGLSKIDKNLIPDLSSLASTGRSYLFRGALDEFITIRDLYKTHKDILEDYYTACKRPLMVTSELGNVPPSWNEDMKWAYGNAGLVLPSISKWATTQNFEPYYDPEAVHATYRVEVTMPPIYRTSPGIFRYGDDSEGYGTYSATGGPQVVQIGQLRTNLWNYLHIPFKVLKAHKFLPAGGIHYPLDKTIRHLMELLPRLAQEAPHVHSKGLYQFVLGGLLGIYPDEIEDTYSTATYFNPIFQLFIYEWVDTRRFLRSLNHPGDKVTGDFIDALRILDYPGYKKDPSGLFIPDSDSAHPAFYPNPRRKDKNTDKDSYCKDLVEKAARQGKKEVTIPDWAIISPGMVLQGLAPAKDLGKPLSIKLNLGGELKVSDKIEDFEPKDLVDANIKLRDPDIEEVPKLDSKRPPNWGYKDV